MKNKKIIFKIKKIKKKSLTFHLIVFENLGIVLPIKIRKRNSPHSFYSWDSNIIVKFDNLVPSNT